MTTARALEQGHPTVDPQFGSGREAGIIFLMQGLLLRAKAGTGREELLKDALSYVSIILD